MYDNKLKEKIKEKAVSLGITQSGFCKHNNKTAICFLFPYYKDEENSNLSIYARGLDYHKVARDMIEKILSPFTEDFEIFADIGPLDNIEVAKKSGLGVVGKNQLLINKELGSYFFIGYALTSLDIEPDEPSCGTCISCNKCIEACPGSALTENGFFLENCASHISQKKGELNEEEIEILKKSSSVFGCDICQKVCPMNKGKGVCLPEFNKDRILKLGKKDLENLSTKEFKAKYGDYAFSWRGKGVLLRNIGFFDAAD